MLFPPLAQAEFPGSAAFDVARMEGTGMVLRIYIVLVAVGLIVDAVFLARFLGGRPRWRRQVQRLEWRPWSAGDARRLLVFLLVMYGVALLAQSAGAGLLGLRAGENPSRLVVMESVVFHWAGIGFVLYLMARRRLSWRSAFGADARGLLKQVGTGVLFYLGVMPFVWFYAMLYQVALHWVGYEPELQDVALAMTDQGSLGMRVYLWSLAIVVAPFFEELLFRGIGLPVLTQRLGVHRGVLVISLCFALIHFHVPSVVPLFVLAVAFALAYIYSESLVVPIVMHALFNALNLGLLTYLRYA